MDAFDILLTLSGRDEASQVFQQVSNNAQSSLGAIERNADQTTASISQKFSEIGASIQQGLSNVDLALMNLNSANQSIMGSLGATKSAMDYVYGTTSTAQTNQVLMKNWQDETATYQELYDTVDAITDKSLTSMQDLIPAMNAFKASTQATGKVMKDNVAEGMAQFGAYVLSLTGSQQLAKTAMTDLSKGLVGRGAFSALDQYGVTKETLMARGWSGENEDIEGYMNAVRKVSGVVDELMDTSQGVEARMGKMWSRAGKRIGREMLPGIMNIKEAFMDLDDKLDGDLSTSILRISLLLEETSQKAHTLNTIFMGFQNVTKILRGVAQWYGLIDTETKNSVQMKQAENQEIAMNNELLATNTDLRLANAEAMGFQGVMGEGVSYEGGEYIEGGGEEGNWSTDVLANTAGGMLESKYDRLRYGSGDTGKVTGATRSEAKQIQELIKNTEHNRKIYEEYENVLWQFGTANASISDTAKKLQSMPETGMYGTSFFNRLNQESAVAEKVLKDLDSNSSRLNKKMEKVGDTYVKSNPMNKMTPLTSNWGKMNLPKTNIGDEFSKLDTLMGTHTPPKASLNADSLKGMVGGFNREAFEQFVKQNDGERKRVAKLLGELGENDTLEETFEQIQKSELGPFNRLSIWLNEKKKRKLPSLNTDFGLSSIASGFKNRIGTGISNLKNAFTNVSTNFNQFRSLTFADKMDNVWDKLKNSFNGLRGGGAVMTEVATEMGTTASAASVVATESQVVGAESMIAGEGMAEAEAGLSFMGLAEMGLVGAFTTLIVPTLAIAAVIAILIPIVAGLAIEAMYFIVLVGQVMSAMDWGSIDVDSAVEGLKSLAIALGYLSLAMLSLSVTGILTGLAFIMTGFGNVQAVLGQAVSMLRSATTELNKLNGITVDESVASNLQNLGNALNGVSMAMMSLSGVTLAGLVGNILTLGGQFGTLSSNLDKAKTDIQHAIEVINSMDFAGIDEDKIAMINNTFQAIGAFGEAFKGLSDIRTTQVVGDFTTWLLGGGIFGVPGPTIKEAFAKAHDDIKEAVEALKSYTDLDKVPEGIGEKLKNVADAITSVADIIKALKEVKDDKGFLGALDGFLNGGNDNLVVGLQKALVTIRMVATRINSLKTISNIDELVPKKLKAISDTIKTISDVMTGFSNVKSFKDDGSMASMPSIIQKVTHNLRLVSGQLNSLKTISNIDPLVATKVQAVATTLEGVNTALAQFSAINSATGGWNFENLNQRIVGVRTAISSAAFQLNTLGKAFSDGTHSVPEGLGGQIDKVASAMGSVKKFATNMTTFPVVDGTVIGYKVARAVTGFKRAATYLRKITQEDNIGDIGGIISKVSSAVQQLKIALQGMNFGSTGVNIGLSLSRGVTQGLSGLTPRVTGAVGRASSAGASRGWTGGAYIGQSMNGGFQSAFHINNLVSTEIDNAIGSIQAKTPDASSAMGALAQAMVDEFKSRSDIKSPGIIARSMFAEMNYMHGFILDGGVKNVRAMGEVATGLVKNFNPDFTLDNGRINTLRNMNSNTQYGGNQNPVNIIIGEGAIQLDARNLTTSESRQIMINAIEGLDVIQSVNIRGI